MAINKDNFCVIMGGGIGSRFWPFSRKTLPKQFLDFFGTGRSLLQQTFDRFKKIIPTENIIVVTNALYADLVRQQLPELKAEQILLEPARRNTAPCIAWASYHIRAINPNANIVVAPSDHLILKEEEFLTAIEKGLDFVAGDNKLLTLGIKPNRPETGYGYIQIAEPAGENFYKVKTFTEKPELELAKVFVESGEFYWNSGIFIWKVRSIIEAFEKYLPEHHQLFSGVMQAAGTEAERRVVEIAFSECRAISIDYGIMEKADNVYVRCGEFGWSDVGTWGSVYQHSRKDRYANTIPAEGCYLYDTRSSIVSLPAGKIAVISGLKEYIVVDTDDVLMICPRAEEQNIKKFIDEVKFHNGDKHI